MIVWPSIGVENDESGLATVSRRRGVSPAPGRSIERRDVGKSDAVSVPAVERAIAILRHLEDNPEHSAGTVSNMARALGMNKSTCSNILRTMGAAGLIEYDTDSKAYRLGPELIGLGVKASQHREFPGAGMSHLQALARQTSFTCLAFEQLPTSEFVVVGKIESVRDIKVTIDVGQHFPPNAPVMSRICLAWQSDVSAQAYTTRWGLPAFTRATKTDRKELTRELSRIRAQGYGITRGEYYLANTVIAAPVFSPRKDACRGVCIVAFSSDIADNELNQYAEKVRAAAQAITFALGGRFEV